ncbi:MAG: hypothetical protein ACSHXF_06245 [Aquaticitalea sp.]
MGGEGAMMAMLTSLKTTIEEESELNLIKINWVVMAMEKNWNSIFPEVTSEV